MVIFGAAWAFKSGFCRIGAQVDAQLTDRDKAYENMVKAKDQQIEQVEEMSAKWEKIAMTSINSLEGMRADLNTALKLASKVVHEQSGEEHRK
jgi:hypothetical protein